MDYVLALDQGTSSSRALLYDAGLYDAGSGGGAGRVVATEQIALPMRTPQPGWAEQDAERIWTTQRDAARAVLSRCDAGDRVLGVGIANQRETVVVWDRATLSPIGPAVSWQCRRTAAACVSLAERWGAAIRARTGLVADAYFSGPKIAWLLDQAPGARARAERGELAAGTVDAWLLARLTGGLVHATEATNASRTMLWDIHAARWDAELCAAQGVPAAVLPEVLPAVSRGGTAFGVTAVEALGRALPVLAMVGDQQSALVGQGCVAAGSLKVTYGTGAFLLTHTGASAVGPPAGRTPAARADAGLLTTRAVSLPGEDARFALEGNVFSAGSLVDWLADLLGVADGSAVSDLASGVTDSGGVLVVPAQGGLGAPHWRPAARTLLAGVSAATGRGELARAALEGIAFRVREVVEASEAAMGSSIGEVRVDGGLSMSDALMQIQADVLQRPLVRPADVETTARGAALLAGLAAGCWDALPAPDAAGERRFRPQGDLEATYGRWREALAASVELGG